jgi:glucokinase
MKTTSQAALSAVALATAAATVSIYILKKRRKKTTYIIAGDIGGTNSRFALHRQGEREPLLVHVYPNELALATTKSYHHATLKPFLEKCVAEVEEWSCMDADDIRNKVQVVACLATAGPVNTTKNNVYMTNMGKGGQSIDGTAIEECQDGLLSIVVRCKLVNDFVGQGEREYIPTSFRRVWTT